MSEIRSSRHVWTAALLGGLVAGCAPLPPTPTKPAGPSIRSEAQVQPGCLRPSKALFAAAPFATNIDLRIYVELDGTASKATVASSSGNAALDQAFVAAALKCRYTPARLLDDTAVASNYVMTQSWIAGQSSTGPQRCFLPDYPKLALRAERSGQVRIRFMVPDAAAHAEVRVMPPTDPAFAEAAHASATGCLAHAEAREGLKPQQWYEVAFNFHVH